jgi:hypothetical protein
VSPGDPQIAWRGEIWSAWKPLFIDALPTLALLVSLGLVFQLLWRVAGGHLSFKRRELVVRVFVVLTVALGLAVAVDKASLFDDAHISFRYAKNFVDGHGLVWNVGERVEGYTNFLWTILIAFFMWFFQVDAPWIGLVLSLVAFAANLVVIARLSSTLARDLRPGAVTLPFAALLLAVQDTFSEYGTTGLETGFASLLVNIGVLLLVEKTSARATFAALVLILAVLTRPDHSLFYAVGSLVVLLSHIGSVFGARREGVRAMWRAGVDVMAAYAAPFTIYLVYLAWKFSFYGSIVPNTYYTKSANLSYWSQGEIYGRVFLLQSHFWVVLPVFLVVVPFAFRASDKTRRFVLFALPSTIAYIIYVWKIGGDFMHGRFYVTLLPLVVVGALLAPEVLPRRAVVARLTPGVALASLVFVLGNALPFFVDGNGYRKVRWYIVAERLFYPVKQFAPLIVDHDMEAAGRAFGALADKGIRPTIATTGIGLVGYHSNLELIDLMGLTDATVAHTKLHGRSRPGHEKRAPHEYLVKRSPHFMREAGSTPVPYRKLVEIHLGPGTGGPWMIFRYDRALMRRIEREQKTIRFTNFERHLDRYIRELEKKSLSDVEKDFAFFKGLYFDHNDDAARQQRFEQWIVAQRAATHPGETTQP